MARARPAVVQPLIKTPSPTDPRWQFSLGPDFIAWSEEHLRIPRGERRGQPMVWAAWQKEWFTEQLRCDEDGNLFYRMALLGVPKKNTKSGMSSALGVWHVFGDEYSTDPWVAISANSDRQADIIFGDAKTMAELNELMKSAANLYKWEVRLKGIESGHPHMERVAASKGNLDGKDCSLVLFDEVHEAERESWRILTNSIVGRPRAQVFATTTAGFDRESVLGDLFERGRRIATGELPPERFLMWWYGAPDGADYRSAKVWAAANPNYGITVTEETLRHELSKNTEAEFRRYFLNQWTKVENAFFPHGALADCEATGPFEFEDGAETFVGWDGSTRVDSTALVAGQWFDIDGEKVLCVKCWAWERPRDMNGDWDESWVIPMAEEVLPTLRGLFERYQVAGCAYDPAFITWEARELLKAGHPMIEWHQTDARMVPATAALYQLVINQRLLYFDEPTLVRHLENSVAKQTLRGGVRLTKGRERKANDLAIALAMVCGLAMPKDEEATGVVAYIPGKEKEDEGGQETD